MHVTNYYNVGKIVNTHGLKGEVRVITFSDFKEERYRPGNSLHFFKDEQSNEAMPLTITSYRTHKQFDLLTFEGYESIEAVERFKGGLLKVTEEDRTELAGEEYYFDQIIGCDVHTISGDYLGIIHSILSPGANDVWVVKSVKTNKDVYIPYISDVVKKVDVDNKRVEIQPLEGLLE